MGTRVTQAGRGLMEADRDLPPPTLSDALWLAVVVLGVADCIGLAPGLHH